jgi:large repetitive protein
VTFTAEASGSPAPRYQWRKNGVDIAGATAASLLLSNVQSVDGGSYSLVAINAVGSTMSDAAVLTVATPPAITTQPSDQIVVEGQPVTFRVSATGTPAPAYQWFKDGTAIPGASAASYVIDRADAKAAGSYTVTASNAAGAATSRAAALTVVPVIIGLPGTGTTIPGGTVSVEEPVISPTSSL